jgi:hypothetical protein
MVVVGIGKRALTSGSFSMTWWPVSAYKGQNGETYAVDVICKFGPLVLVDGVAHVGIGALDSNFAGLGR